MRSRDGKVDSGFGRHAEYDRQAKKARDVFGDLDFIDELPDPPRRIIIPFPYEPIGPPRPLGWDLESAEAILRRRARLAEDARRQAEK
ncbi:MAG: hypothetical protein OXU68_01400 [Bacteroidota bacterium]|nr:hypothetical protein [Bacteroidota bacterium]MDE2955655.1 hypothetical protein [Bacteroidota bacterium]